MRSKALLALLAVTAVALIAAVTLSLKGNGPTAAREAGALVLPGFAEELGQADRVTLVHGQSKVTMLRQGDNWMVDEKSRYPADGPKLHQLFLGLEDLRYVEPKTKKPDLYPRIEVEDAAQPGSKSTLVTVGGEKAGVLAALILGRRRTDALGGGVDGVYLRKPNDAQSWLAQGTIELPEDVNGWLDRKLVDIAETQIKEAVLVQPDGAKLDIARDKPEAKLALKGAPADIKLKPDTPVDEPARALAGLELADVRPASDMPLPAEGVSHATYTTFDGLKIELALFDKDGKHWAHITAKGTGDAEKTATALNDKLSPWTYALLDYKDKLLKTKLADLTAPKAS